MSSITCFHLSTRRKGVKTKGYKDIRHESVIAETPGFTQGCRNISQGWKSLRSNQQ